MKRALKMLAYTLSGIIALGVLASLFGCSEPPAPSPAENAAPAPGNLNEIKPVVLGEPAAPNPPIETVSDAIGATVTAAVEVAEVIAEPRIVPPPALPLLDEDCIDLLVKLEVGGVSIYRQRYYMPIKPPGESGVTIGLGYDLRFVTEQILRTDWQAHAQLERLVGSVGLYGAAADQAVAQLSDVHTPYELARAVFVAASAPVYWQITRRMFVAKHFDVLDRDYQCGLFLIGYNRGGAMAGPRRAELRTIRDECVPKADKPCAANQNRLSKRHWRGTDIERGMNLRREAESVRIERKSA